MSNRTGRRNSKQGRPLDTREAIKIVRRLWLVALAGVVLSMSCAAYIGNKLLPSYEAGASVLLLSPAVATDSGGNDVATNPFVLTGPAERVAASAVLTVTGSEQWEAAMEAAGAEGDYEYELDEAAPIISVKSAAETPEEALNTLDVATRLFRERFEENQMAAGAPPDRLIDSKVLSSTVTPAKVIGSRVRSVAGVIVLGLMATGAVLFLLDARAPGWTPSLRAVHLRLALKEKLAPLRSHEGARAAADDADG